MGRVMATRRGDAVSIRIKLKSGGVKKLLHDSGVESNLRRRAESVAAAAGSGLDDSSGMAVVEAGDGKRARYVVLTTTFEARLAESKHRALTSAIDAAR